MLWSLNYSFHTAALSYIQCKLSKLSAWHCTQTGFGTSILVPGTWRTVKNKTQSDKFSEGTNTCTFKVTTVIWYIHVLCFWQLLDTKMITYNGSQSFPQIQTLLRTLGYHRFVLYSTLGHVGGSNSCGGYTLMRFAVTHANGALVYPSQGGRYRAEGCMALG